MNRKRQFRKLFGKTEYDDLANQFVTANRDADCDAVCGSSGYGWFDLP